MVLFQTVDGDSGSGSHVTCDGVDLCGIIQPRYKENAVAKQTRLSCRVTGKLPGTTARQATQHARTRRQRPTGGGRPRRFTLTINNS
jgi:hypothetical protein